MSHTLKDLSNELGSQSPQILGSNEVLVNPVVVGIEHPVSPGHVMWVEAVLPVALVAHLQPLTDVAQPTIHEDSPYSVEFIPPSIIEIKHWSAVGHRTQEP